MKKAVFLSNGRCVYEEDAPRYSDYNKCRSTMEPVSTVVVPLVKNDSKKPKAVTYTTTYKVMGVTGLKPIGEKACDLIRKGIERKLEEVMIGPVTKPPAEKKNCDTCAYWDCNGVSWCGEPNRYNKHDQRAFDWGYHKIKAWIQTNSDAAFRKRTPCTDTDYNNCPGWKGKE